MKKILLSITLIGASFFSQAQTLFTDNFDALNVGNLGTDITGATPGQNYWGTYVGSGGANSDFQIVNVGASDNELKLTGPLGTTSNATTRYAFQYFDWAGRTAGNEVIYSEFKISTGAAGITSTNNFNIVFYDATLNKILVGFTYSPKTKLIKGLAFFNNAGTLNNYSFSNLNNGVALPALTANSEISVQMAFDKLTGNVYWAGSGAGVSFSYAIPGAAIGIDPAELDVYVTGSGAATSATCNFDDFLIRSQPCANPSLTSRDAAVSMVYTNNSLCKDLASVTPTITPATVGGTFYSSSAINYVGQTTAGQSTTGEINPSLSTAGSYIVTYYTAGSATSCSYPSRDTVTIKAMPSVPSVVTSGPTIFCASSSVILSTPAALNTSYLWSNSTNNDSTTVNTTGNYTVTATTNGCSTTSLATAVTVNPLPAAPVITPIGSLGLCPGGSVSLSSATASSYNWSTGATTQAITTSTPATYTVSITDANGCVSPNGSVTVTANPTQDASFSYGGNTFCVSGGTASANLVQPTLTGTFSSTSGLDIVPSTGLITPNNSTPGQYVVTFISNSTSNSCTDTKTQTITITNSPVATFNYTAASFCNSASNQTVTFTNGGSAGVFSAGNGLSINSSTGTINVALSTPGNYTVTNTINASGCAQTSAPFNVEIKALPSVTVNNSTICQGQNATITATPGVSGNYSYAWTVPNGVNAPGNIASFTSATAGNYSVVITNATTTCSSTSALGSVTVNALNTVGLNNATVCAGNNATLLATPNTSGSYTYTWTVPNGAANPGNTTTLVTQVPGTYTVSLVNNNTLCPATTATGTVIVNQLPAVPTVTANGPTTFCQGGNVVLTSTSSNGYSWSNQATTPAITVTASGNYSVTITDGNGCSSVSAPTNVTVNALPSVPTITANGPTTFCQGGNVVLTSTSSNGYSWSNQATTPAITVTSTGNYSVTITDGNGCSNVSAPTAVTVNGCAGIEENTNNTFVVYPNPANETINVTFSNLSDNGTVQLFTAEGKVIESKEISNSMTATFDVVNLTSGVYYVVITSDNGRVSQKVIIE